MVQQFLIDLAAQVGAYILIIVATIFLFNWWSVGFFTTWIRVKTSRGKKVLVRVNTIVQDYYRVGVISEGFLLYKNKMKEDKRISLNSNDNPIHRSMGVSIVYVDDEKNCVITADFKSVSGFDAVKFQDLYLRALYKPLMLDNNTKILIFMLVILMLGLAFVGYTLHGDYQATLKAIEALKTVGSNVTATAVTSGGA